MAITAKPKKASTPSVNVDALISKGGSVATSEVGQGSEEPETKPVLVRIPADVLKDVDAQIKAAKVRVPRNQWIIEAIVQRTERDAQ